MAAAAARWKRIQLSVPVTTQVATFQVVNSFGLIDTRWAPILLYMGTDIVSVYPTSMGSHVATSASSGAASSRAGFTREEYRRPRAPAARRVGS